MTPAQRTTLLTDPSLAASHRHRRLSAGDRAVLRRAASGAEVLRSGVHRAARQPAGRGRLHDARRSGAARGRSPTTPKQRLLRCDGHSVAGRQGGARRALARTPPYRNAVNSLFTQPPPVVPAGPAHLARGCRPAVPAARPGRAGQRPSGGEPRDGGDHARWPTSRTTQSENAVIEQSSAQLGLTEAVTRRLLIGVRRSCRRRCSTHLTGPFAATSGVVDYATLPPTFDAWYWAHRSRVAAEEVEADARGLGAAGRADRGRRSCSTSLTLPLNARRRHRRRSIAFLRTSRLLRIRDMLPETGDQLPRSARRS